ncbi:mucin-associated surface protein [Trypanosoma cruzi cruzi]|uniref:Mucin-associated surface protein (MASP) n=1 Tax=Trypanosoma cruzi TaxID=5693 RepID=A0A2V2W0R3_TRYCR|nr:mucin-associated surface protein [Trypanosoma cruzi cruzi]PWV01915.1 Mucin-associated surface protein (MASP) [Trypanosoma cruzi]
MAMMMTGRVLLVCALCVLWCGAGGIHARNPDNNSLGGHMASRGFRRKKSFLSNGSIKNLSTPLLLSASFISAIQAEAREGVPSARVTDSPLSGATVLSPAFSGLGAAANIHGSVVPGRGTAGPGAGAPGNDPAAIPGAIPGHAAAPAGPDHDPAFSGHAAAVPGHAAAPAGPDHDPAFSGLVPAVPGAGHSVVGGSEPLDSRSVVISSSQGGNEKTTPVSVSPDEQIASSKEVLAQKETGSQGTSSPEGQPTVSSNNEKQRNNSASVVGHSLGHDAAGDELQDPLEEQQKNDHSQTNETKKSSEDQNTESPSSGGALSEVSNTTTHGINTQQPKTNPANKKNYSQNTDASHTTSPLLLLLVVVACAAAAAVVAA